MPFYRVVSEGDLTLKQTQTSRASPSKKVLPLKRECKENKQANI